MAPTGWKRGSAHGQLQKSTTGKFHWALSEMLAARSYSATLVEIIGVVGRLAGYPPLDPPGAELPSAEKNQWLGLCSKRNAHFTGLFFRQLCRGRSPSRPSRRPRPWRGQY